MRRTTRLTPIVLTVLGLVPAGNVPASMLTRLTAPSFARRPTVTILFTTTVPAVVPPATTRDFLMWYAVVGPGVRVTSPATQGPCCPGTQVTHVLSGTYALRVAGPLRVLHGEHTGRSSPPEAVAPGTEVVLRAGDTAVADIDLLTTYANTGTDSVHLVVERLGSHESSSPATTFFLPNGDESSQAPLLSRGPLAITLQQATLAADGLLPAPPPGDFRTVMTRLALASLETERDGAVQNLGQTAVVVYALTLHPVGSAGGTPLRKSVSWWGEF
jgi:hypothetical protein